MEKNGQHKVCFFLDLSSGIFSWINVMLSVMNGFVMISFPMKQPWLYGLARMGLDDYPAFLPKTTFMYYFAQNCKLGHRVLCISNEIIKTENLSTHYAIAAQAVIWNRKMRMERSRETKFSISLDFHLFVSLFYDPWYDFSERMWCLRAVR